MCMILFLIFNSRLQVKVFWCIRTRKSKNIKNKYIFIYKRGDWQNHAKLIYHVYSVIDFSVENTFCIAKSTKNAVCYT